MSGPERLSEIEGEGIERERGAGTEAEGAERRQPASLREGPKGHDGGRPRESDERELLPPHAQGFPREPTRVAAEPSERVDIQEQEHGGETRGDRLRHESESKAADRRPIGAPG